MPPGSEQPCRCQSCHDDNVFLVLFVCSLALMRQKRPRYRAVSKYRARRWTKILDSLDGSHPQTSKEIGHRSGLRPDSALRSDLAELVRQGKIRRERGTWGYVRCCEPSPDSASPEVLLDSAKATTEAK
jgi:hypothetical protein